MKKFLIAVMLASMCVLISSFAFAQEKVTLVEVGADSKSAAVWYGDKKLVLTSKSEVIEPLSPDISTSAAEEFEAQASKLEVAEVETSTKNVMQELKSFYKKDKKLSLLFHTGMMTMKGVDTQSQPSGVTATPDQSANSMYYSLELKHKWVGIEWRPSGREQKLQYMADGAPLGSLMLKTGNAFFLKVYPYSTPKGSVYIGVGKEYNSLDGNVSLGGFPLHSYLKGGPWTTKLLFGAQYNATKWLGLNVGYERGGAEVVTDFDPMLGVPKPVTTLNTDLFLVGITLKVL